MNKLNVTLSSTLESETPCSRLGHLGGEVTTLNHSICTTQQPTGQACTMCRDNSRRCTSATFGSQSGSLWSWKLQVSFPVGTLTNLTQSRIDHQSLSWMSDDTLDSSYLCKHKGQKTWPNGGPWWIGWIKHDYIWKHYWLHQREDQQLSLIFASSSSSYRQLPRLK